MARYHCNKCGYETGSPKEARNHDEHRHCNRMMVDTWVADA